MRRKARPITKRPIPHAKHVVSVASGKGGVGKSTVAANLAVALVLQSLGRNPRVGLLDLDIFGPSVPKLMGLEGLPPPELTKAGAIIPFSNHELQCMPIGLMVPQTADTAVVWRGLMIQKATQQLLFDVDWRGRGGEGHPGLDVLVIDMPPGTGDVQLTSVSWCKLTCCNRIDRRRCPHRRQEWRCHVPQGRHSDHWPPSQHGAFYLLNLLNTAPHIRAPHILAPNRRCLEPQDPTRTAYRPFHKR